jgi:hypothetical protein
MLQTLRNLGNEAEAAAEEIDRLQARCAALEADAMRYRWLRDKADFLRRKAGSPQVCLTDDALDDFTFDCLIASSAGVGRKIKRLMAHVQPAGQHLHFKVTHGEDTLLLCNDFSAAIATYNDLP